ncbi:MAG: zinc ABC transporter substrate-binding protein [candidate division WOR-3 bacterium]
MRNLILLLILIACKNVKDEKVFVSIYPLKLVLNEILVNSEVIIENPVDIHSFEPSIKKILNAQNSCAFIYISDNFETWAKNIKAKYKLKLLQSEQNPHIWTNPTFILNNLDKIEDILLKCKISYEKQKLIKLKEKLKSIDSLNKIYSKDVKKSFILFHTSFEPFLRHYNLKIEAILLKEGHGDILPSDLEKALNSKDKILIVESYYSEHMLKPFIKNNFKIISIDPLGTNFKNYTEFIKFISESILLNKYVLKENL